MRVGKLINGALGVVEIVVNNLGVAVKFRVLLPKDLQNLLRMGVIFGKNNGLSQLLAVVDPQSVSHKSMEDLPDGILVEHPLVESGGIDLLRQGAVLVLKGVFILRFVLLGQLIIDDTFLNELQFGLYREEVHQKAVLHRLGQLVAIGGHAALQFKNVIGILVDLILGGSGKAHQRRVKVVENIPVFVVDGAVGLVTDHQVEMPTGEKLTLLVPHRVDAIHHGLIGGKHTPGGIIVLLLAEIGHRQIGQQIDKAPFRLGH